MAYDALRLRNVIQLAGILGVLTLASVLANNALITHYLPVFHLALLVFAALQIHQTETALVTLGDCLGSENYVVGGVLFMSRVGIHVGFRTVAALDLYGRRSNLSLLSRHASSLHHGLSCCSGSRNCMPSLGKNFA